MFGGGEILRGLLGKMDVQFFDAAGSPFARMLGHVFANISDIFLVAIDCLRRVCLSQKMPNHPIFLPMFVSNCFDF